jgi:uncharacterized membrane protein
MTAHDSDTVVDGYLRRLDVALSSMPAARREQLLEEIAQHVAEGRRELSEESPAALLQLLDRIGRPEDIAAAALEENQEQRVPSSYPESRGGDMFEVFTLCLLLFGGFLFVIGWLVGVALLWSSSAWRIRDKILSTLVFPGGFLLPVYLFGVVLVVAHGTSCVHNVPANGTPTTQCVTTTTGTVLPQWAGIVLLAVLVIAPFLMAVHLHRAKQLTTTN